jgi:hypothetical protein
MWWSRFFTSKQKNTDTFTSTRSVPTVKFDQKLITPAILDDIRSTVAHLNEIPTQFQSALYTIAVKMIRRGGDLHYFYQEVSNLRINSLDRHTIEELSLFIWVRSKSLIEIRRMISVGVTECEWLYSGAPCDFGLDKAHRAANHQRFNVAQGLVVNGKPTWPGRERGCKCIIKPIVKGFS